VKGFSRVVAPNLPFAIWLPPLPPLPRLNISSLANLEQQLRFSPKDALLRDILRIEGLSSQIEDNHTYPEDWIIERITGHLPEIAEPAQIVGEALKADLSSLVERLCDAGKIAVADFSASDLVDADEICRRWNMSRRTLVRMRKRGLVGRRLLAPDGKPRVMFDRSIIARFENEHPDQVARAADYSRISERDEARMIRRAVRYKKFLGWSLNMAAERISERFDRSHEAVRQVLKRFEMRAKAANDRSRAGMLAPNEVVPDAIFNEADPLTEKRREAVYRAWRLGVDPALLCSKTRRSRPALRRAVNIARAIHLTRWADDGFLGDDFPGDDHSAEAAALASINSTAADKLQRASLRHALTNKKRGAPAHVSPLDAAPVVTGLARPVPRHINAFIAEARTAGPVIAIEERARLDAYHHLRAAAHPSVRELHRLFPRAGSLDQIETQLRWAARLKVELIRGHLRNMIETVEGRLSRTMEDLPRTSMPKMLIEGIQRIGDAIDHFDSSRGGRLASAVGLAMDKHAVRWLKELKPLVVVGRLRASPLQPNAPDLPDWSRLVSVWQKELEPHFRVRIAAESGKLDPVMSAFLIDRFGWYGGPPRMLNELTEKFNFTFVRAAIFEQRAIHAATTMKI